MPADKSLDALAARIARLEYQLDEAVRILKDRPASSDECMSKRRRVPWGTQVKTFLRNYRETPR